MSFQGLAQGAQLVLSVQGILLIFLGVLLGLLLGAAPGVGPVPGIALLIPLTIDLDPLIALSMLVAIYIGGMYGGAVTAILLNIPGTAGAIASTFEGYPLSLKGRAEYAITISVLASGFGTIISAIVLIISVPFLVQIISLFGTVEYALIAVFGITVIPLVSQDTMNKTLLMGGFGALLSSVGIPIMSATPRFNLGILELSDGVGFIPILLGLFAIAEMIKLAPYEGTLSDSSEERESVSDTTKKYGVLRSIPDRTKDIFIQHPISFFRSISIALVIGLIPAAGGAISNILAYATEKESAEDTRLFGAGDIRGLIAAESANSGTIASTLVPLLAFGIPGSPTAAVIFGGMLMHGVNPGPGLFKEAVHITYGVFFSVIIGGFCLLIAGMLTAYQMTRLTELKMDYIIPPIIVLCFVGAYGLSLSTFDVLQVVLSGFMGYAIIKYNYSIVALMMGLILGPIIEENIHRAFQISQGDPFIFVQTPVALILTVAIGISVVLPLASGIRNY